MKKLFYLAVITGFGALLFYPFKPDSVFFDIQSGMRSLGKSKADYKEALMDKREELVFYEKMIEDITTRFENQVANAPICPKTGRKIEIRMRDDPRPELASKCDVLRAQIQKLEEKLSD